MVTLVYVIVVIRLSDREPPKNIAVIVEEVEEVKRWLNSKSGKAAGTTEPVTGLDGLDQKSTATKY